jgi:hypothetical protein
MCTQAEFEAGIENWHKAIKKSKQNLRGVEMGVQYAVSSFTIALYSK